MSKNFRTCDLDQPFLLPFSLQDWLPENHLARFIAELAIGLDLSKIYGYVRTAGWAREGGVSPGDDGAIAALQPIPFT